jgi:hypothetical protein
LLSDGGQIMIRVHWPDGFCAVHVYAVFISVKM